MSLIGSGFSGLFNAFAFSGMSFLFKLIDKPNYLAETKRHNLATEKMFKDRERWNEFEVARREKLQKLRQQLITANVDIKTTNEALEEFQKVQKQQQRKEPVLSDYYKPTQEAEEYKLAAVGLSGLAGGWGVYKLVSMLL